MIVRKQFKFEAAHRLPKHRGRCAGLHGHSYRVEVFIEGFDDGLRDGMVVDFGDVKVAIGSFIDLFDHSLILSYLDDLYLNSPVILMNALNPRYIIVPYDPTAEMMAAHIFSEACTRLASHRARVKAVRVWETETGWAECDSLLPISFEQTVYSETLMGDGKKWGRL